MSDERVCLLRGDSMGQDDRREERAFLFLKAMTRRRRRGRDQWEGIIGDV